MIYAIPTLSLASTASLPRTVAKNSVRSETRKLLDETMSTKKSSGTSRI